MNSRGHGNLRVCCSISNLEYGIPKDLTVSEINLTAETPETYNLNRDPFIEIWNGKFYQDFRRKMLNKEQISNCQFCYSLEQGGLWSKRMSRNYFFLGDPEGRFDQLQSDLPLHQQTAMHIQRTKELGGYSKQPPKWLEVRFSTVCNLKCVMCSPSLSTALFNEYKVNFKDLSKRQRHSLQMAEKLAEHGQLRNSTFFIDQIRTLIQGAQCLELRGGEILQDHKLLAFIKEISAQSYAKHLLLDITTNGIGFNSEHVELLNQFRGGVIKMSIDAFGVENEYIRYPSRWHDTVRGLKKMVELHEGWSVQIQPTISVFQALTIDKLLWFLDTFALQYAPRLRLSISKIRSMPHLELNQIPLELREGSAQKVKTFADKSYLCSKLHPKPHSNLNPVLGLAQTLLEPEDRVISRAQALKSHVEALEKIRGLDFQKVFPHLAFVYPRPALSHEERAL